MRSEISKVRKLAIRTNNPQSEIHKELQSLVNQTIDGEHKSRVCMCAMFALGDESGFSMRRLKKYTHRSTRKNDAPGL